LILGLITLMTFMLYQSFEIRKLKKRLGRLENN